MQSNRRQLVIALGMMATASLILQTSSALGQDPPEGEPPQLELDGRGVPIGCDLIEGDIIICGPSGGRTTYAANLWTNSIVPYEFDANVSAQNQQYALDAMAEWAAVATISFEPFDLVQHGWNHIRIRDSTGDEEPGNSSAVGMSGGEQVINIVSWWAHFIIVHEFGHALGYWHEQSNPDRDNYVQIEWDRIIEGKDHNFAKHPLAGTYGPYDFDSVMHYGQCAFSCCGADPDVACTTTSCASDLENCRTITVLPPYDGQWQNAIGQRNHLSFWDIQVMAWLYPESDWYFVGHPSAGLGTGTYLDPWSSLNMAYTTWAPEGATIWVLEPGDWVIGTNVLDRPMTIRSGRGTVNLLP